MRYRFILQTYNTERLKVIGVWSSLRDKDLAVRPHPTDTGGRSVVEQMIYQCVSEDNWFKSFFGADVGAPPLPVMQNRMGFITRYWADSGRRLDALRTKDEAFWEQEVSFFEVPRSRAWILVRRIAHTAHHRGQQMAMLRMLNREIYGTCGPTADTGDKVVYAYPDIETLVEKMES